MDSGDIGEVIKQRLKDFDAQTVTADVGRVISVSDGIAQVYGLRGAMASELLEFPGDVYGMALNLEDDRVGAVLLGAYEQIEEGAEVRTTGRIVEVPVGPELLGRTVNPLGQPLDGQGPIQAKQTSAIEKIAPRVITRGPVDTPVQTGILVVDTMIAVGRGQRELVIGDRQTGKTQVLLDTIVNQKGKNLFCIYCAIGQNAASIARVRAMLEEHGALEYTTIVAATASEPAALSYIAPYAACAMGEYYRDSGQDALVCYDDLTKHAWAYRELSLTLRRPPGREAYPGDVFYLHSRLLERAAKLNEAHGGGSLTALPVIETQEGDISAYIPTNVISITDGQLFLESDLFNSGLRPAISPGNSVSRVGSAAQTKPVSRAASGLRFDLSTYRELAAFAQFASDLDAQTRSRLERGQRLTQLLVQKQFEPIHVGAEVSIIYAGTRGLVDKVEIGRVIEWKEGFVRFLMAERRALIDGIEQDQKWDQEIEDQVKEAIEAYNRQFGVGSESTAEARV